MNKLKLKRTVSRPNFQRLELCTHFLITSSYWQRFFFMVICATWIKERKGLSKGKKGTPGVSKALHRTPELRCQQASVCASDQISSFDPRWLCCMKVPSIIHTFDIFHWTFMKINGHFMLLWWWRSHNYPSFLEQVICRWLLRKSWAPLPVVCYRAVLNPSFHLLSSTNTCVNSSAFPKWNGIPTLYVNDSNNI